MKNTKILIIGYSSFARRRIIRSLKKNKKINYCVCSKSNKINLKKKIFYNNYGDALKKFNPKIVYISTVNSLHYKYAKELLRIAKTKKLLFAEAILFNYHRVFDVIKRLSGGFKKIEHIQSNFNIPLMKNLDEIKEIEGDCESDMSIYAAAILRLFTKNGTRNLQINRNYFKNTKLVKNFYITSSSKACTYFGNFALQKQYTQQIIFYTRDKIIYSPQRIFALPYNKDLEIILKTKNKIKKIKVKKDDCIDNFFKYTLIALQNKRYNFFYNTMLQDAVITSSIKKNID